MMGKFRKKQDEPNLPKEWHRTTAFDAYMAWFTNDPEKRYSEESQEHLEHKGWWVHLPVVNALDGIADSQVQALQIIKNGMLNWKLERGRDRAPVQLSSQELKALWERFRSAKLDPPRDGVVYSLFEVYGDFALKAEIDFTSFSREFSTTFGSANNPIRSLEQKHCRLLDNLSEEEVILGEGYPRLEGNRLTVGEWTEEFDPSLEVWGSAYSEAMWETEDEGYWLIATYKNNQEEVEEQP
ncbi:MAG: hypothetical protein SFU83_09805 [Meiothermus sp.]|nr:hypothetical protein [Meiothermus sp.]